MLIELVQEFSETSGVLTGRLPKRLRDSYDLNRVAKAMHEHTIARPDECLWREGASEGRIRMRHAVEGEVHF